MQKPEILKAPHPLLREKAQPLEKVSKETLKIVAKLFSLAKKYKGVGLAAPQIGISTRIFVIVKDEETEEEITSEAWINPEVKVLSNKKEMGVEGCLSFPNLELPIKRAKKIFISGLNENGIRKEKFYEGFVARIIQHETDHLDGILFIDRLKPLKVVLMGSPELSVPIFEAIHSHPAFEIALVVTGTDKPKGRGLKIQPTPVALWAEKQGLKVEKPADSDKTLKGLAQTLKRLKPDILLVCAYNKILPKKILLLPKYPAVNIHYSLLPKYRGASPVAAAILAGEKETGITLMQMDEHLDTGPILYQESVKIETFDTAVSLSQRLSKRASEILPSLLVYFVGGLLKASPQKGETSYAHRLKKEDGKIDWQKSPLEIERFIRAMTPWPGAYIEVKNMQIKILKAKLENGKLTIETLQLPGKTPVSFSEFKRNYKELLQAFDPEKVNL